MRLYELFDLMEKVDIEEYRIKISVIVKNVMDSILNDVTTEKLNPNDSHFSNLIISIFQKSISPLFYSLTNEYPLKYKKNDEIKNITEYFFEMNTSEEIYEYWLTFGGLTTNQPEGLNGLFTATSDDGDYGVTMLIAVPYIVLNPKFWINAKDNNDIYKQYLNEVIRKISSTFIHEATHFQQAYKMGPEWIQLMNINSPKGKKLGYAKEQDYYFDDQEIDAFASGVSATLINLIENGKLKNVKDAETLLRTTKGINELRIVAPVIGYYYDAFKYFLQKPQTYKWREETKKARIAKNIYVSFIKKVLYHLNQYTKTKSIPTQQSQPLLRQIANKIFSFFKSIISN
jgi:hypothetical protein